MVGREDEAFRLMNSLNCWITSNGGISDSEEYMEGVKCIGAPIHSSDGMGIAAIGVVAPAYRFSKEKMEKAIPIIKEAAKNIMFFAYKFLV